MPAIEQLHIRAVKQLNTALGEPVRYIGLYGYSRVAHVLGKLLYTLYGVVTRPVAVQAINAVPLEYEYLR